MIGILESPQDASFGGPAGSGHRFEPRIPNALQFSVGGVMGACRWPILCSSAIERVVHAQAYRGSRS